MLLFYHFITAPSVFFFFSWQKVANTPGNSRAKKEKGSTELEKNDSNANQERKNQRVSKSHNPRTLRACPASSGGERSAWQKSVS